MASQPDVDNTDEDPTAEKGAEDESRDVRDIDLVGSRRISPGELPTLHLIENKTAGLFAIELSHLLNVEANVFAEPLGVCKFGDLVPELQSPGCLNFLQFEALNGPGLLTIDYDMFFHVLENLFGGDRDLPVSGGENIVRARFSEIEQRVIRRMVRLFGRSMEEAWRPIVPITVRHLRIETDPTNITIASPGEWVVRTRYRIEMDDFEGHFLFALPIDLLEDHQQRLASGRYEERGDDPQHWERILKHHMRYIDMPMTAQLGKTEITLKRLFNLEAGDVLRLDQAPEQPISVNISGKPKYRGKVTVHDGNLAVELKSLHEKTLQ